MFSSYKNTLVHLGAKWLQQILESSNCTHMLYVGLEYLRIDLSQSCRYSMHGAFGFCKVYLWAVKNRTWTEATPRFWEKERRRGKTFSCRQEAHSCIQHPTVPRCATVPECFKVKILSYPSVRSLKKTFISSPLNKIGLNRKSTTIDFQGLCWFQGGLLILYLGHLWTH